MSNALIIFLYVIFAYGLSNLLVYGTGPFDILQKNREFCDKYVPVVGSMLKCMMCTSANIGWISSLLNIIFLPSIKLTPYYLFIGDGSLWFVIIFLDLAFTSGSVWLIHTLQEMLERAFIQNEEEIVEEDNSL